MLQSPRLVVVPTVLRFDYMRVRSWWWERLSLIGVASVTAVAVICPPLGWTQGVPTGSSPDRYRLAAVPEPPTPPRPLARSLDDLQAPADKVIDGSVDPEPDGGLATEVRPVPPSRLAPDDRSEESGPTVQVPPGLPVPTYPMVVNAPVEIGRAHV